MQLVHSSTPESTTFMVYCTCAVAGGPSTGFHIDHDITHHAIEFRALHLPFTVTVTILVHMQSMQQ